MTAQSTTLAPPYFSPAPLRGEGQPVFDWTRMLAEPNAPPTWTVEQAFFAVLFMAAVGDGAVAPIEQEVLTTLVHRSRALKALTPQDLAALNASVIEKLRADPSDALASACAALPQKLRLPTFAHALDIVLADGELRQGEAALLNALAAHLHLAEADVQRVAEVIILKNSA